MIVLVLKPTFILELFDISDELAELQADLVDQWENLDGGEVLVVRSLAHALDAIKSVFVRVIRAFPVEANE